MNPTITRLYAKTLAELTTAELHLAELKARKKAFEDIGAAGESDGEADAVRTKRRRSRGVRTPEKDAEIIRLSKLPASKRPTLMEISKAVGLGATTIQRVRNAAGLIVKKK